MHMPMRVRQLASRAAPAPRRAAHRRRNPLGGDNRGARAYRRRAGRRSCSGWSSCCRRGCARRCWRARSSWRHAAPQTASLYAVFVTTCLQGVGVSQKLREVRCRWQREWGLVALGFPRLRRLTAWRACPQVLEVVMDVGRPPLARFPAGDVRLSETLITYADLDEAIAKVPAGCACEAEALNICVISWLSPLPLRFQICSTPNMLNCVWHSVFITPSKLLHAPGFWQYACMSLWGTNKASCGMADMVLLGACFSRSATVQALIVASHLRSRTLHGPSCHSCKPVT